MLRLSARRCSCRWASNRQRLRTGLGRTAVAELAAVKRTPMAVAIRPLKLRSTGEALESTLPDA